MRTKNKLQHIPLLITVFLISLLINQIPVQAATQNNTKSASAMADYNGTSGGLAEPGYLDYAGSVDRTGLLFYVVDNETNQLVRDLQPLVFMTGTGTKPVDFMDGTTKFGRFNIQQLLRDVCRRGSNWPKNLPEPIKWEDGKWSGNGTEIGEWLLADSENGDTGYETNLKNWEEMILNLDTPGAEKLVKTLHDKGGDITLCIEPLSINYIYYPKINITVDDKKETKEFTTTYYYSWVTTNAETGAGYWSYTGYTDTYDGHFNNPSVKTIDTNDYGLYYQGASDAALVGVLSGFTTDNESVVFGTTGMMAEYGKKALNADLNKHVDLENLQDKKDEYFDTDILDPKPTNQDSGWVYNNDSKITSDTNNGVTRTIVYTRSYSRTYNEWKIKAAEPKLASYKWLNIALPNSLCLAEDQLGLEAPATIGSELDFDDIVSTSKKGYAISMFNDELKKEQINTYNGSDSPGNTEDVTTHKDGHNYVVKKYIEIIHYTSGGETIDTEIKETATHERNKTSGDNGEDNRVCNNILITDEATVRGNKYKLFGWWLRDSYHSTTGKALYNGNVPGVAIASGTTGTEIDTGSEAYGTQDNKCLYILHVYEHSEKKPTTGSIKITLEESEIMRKVELGDSADVAESTENIFSSAKFKWDYAAYTDHSGLCLTA